ncbi:hypothetical protein [uncultured Metabacillus sp.]|uniref:hypothetical protein n=1 Tax=uncultured Metabacillus sp. TaxID=2860135 RepID=UPI002601ED93|nr:hypothetical protein [uncultured Metabacillus sp.]
MIKVFPNIITRISPISISSLNNLRMNKTLNIMEDLKDRNFSFESLTDEISNDLYNQIQKVDDEQLRRNLLNLKRDIYNKRNISKDFQNILSGVIINDGEFGNVSVGDKV